MITLQRKKDTSKQDQLIYFLLGTLVFALFAIKFSAGIIMFLLVIVALIFDKGNAKITFLYFVFFTGGFLSMGIFVFGLNLFNWLVDYYYTLKFLSGLTTASTRIFHLGYLLLLDRLDQPSATHGTVAAEVLARAQAAVRRIYKGRCDPN